MWSITYHSWLTFVYLLAACIIWMMPKKRHVCLVVSPIVVCYTEALLALNYIYGLNLTEEELPEETDGGYHLGEIGLVRHDVPCAHLGVQIAFSVAFLLTLRQHMREVHLRKHEQLMQQDPSFSLEHGSPAHSSTPHTPTSPGPVEHFSSLRKQHCYFSFTFSRLRVHVHVCCAHASCCARVVTSSCRTGVQFSLEETQRRGAFTGLTRTRTSPLSAVELLCH